MSHLTGNIIKSHLTVLHYICCMLSAPLEGELVFHACHNNILDLSYSPVGGKQQHKTVYFVMFCISGQRLKKSYRKRFLYITAKDGFSSY